MKLVNTILLLVAAGLLLTFILVFEREHLTTSQKQLKDQRLALFRPQNINVVEIENAGVDMRLTYRDGLWKVRAPFTDLADPEKVQELLGTLASIEVIRKSRIEDGGERRETYKELGLDTDKQSVLLKGDGPQVHIIFGVDTPSGEGVYARLKPSSELAQIRKEVKENVFLSPDDLRDAQLSRVEAKNIKEIRVRRKEGDMWLELKEGFWEFRKPLQDLADNQAVYDTLNKVLGAKIEKFAANTKDQAAVYGLDDGYGVIHMITQDDDKVVVRIGLDTPDGKSVYASINGRDGIFQLPAEVKSFISQAPDMWRERRVLRMPEQALTNIEVRVGKAPPTKLARQEYGWLLEMGQNGTPAQQSFVTGLIQWLSEARVQDFVSASKAKRAELGLDEPRYRITFEARSPEEMAKLNLPPPDPEKPQEKTWPTKAEIIFGKEVDGVVYVETPFQNAIVSIPAAALNEMPQTPYMWRSLLLQAFPEEQFAWVEFRPLHGEPSRFQRGKDGAWEQTAGSGRASMDYVRSALESLGRLRAFRYVQQKPSDEHGLDEPVMTVEFKLRGEEVPRRLKIGAPAGADGFYAQLEGLDAVFILSRTDYEVLMLPLELENAAPAPEGEAKLTP